MMDKKIAGILGAVGALASMNSAQAVTTSDPTEVLKAGSYADLLEPIPNAMAALRAVDDAGVVTDDKIQLAYRHHHHHHHHHGFRRDRRIIVLPRRHHHHHHHHHHRAIIIR